MYSFLDSVKAGVQVIASMECQGNETSASEEVAASVDLVTSGSVATGMQSSQIVQLSFEVPASPCGGTRAGTASVSLRMEISGKAHWQPLMKFGMFEYRAPGIVEVTPPGGYINRGGDIVLITVVLENVDHADDSVRVSLGGRLCQVLEISSVEASDVSLTNIRFEAPQFPRDRSGILILTVNSSSWESAFSHEWEFMEPLSPKILDDSIKINDEHRDPLWVKKVASSVEVSIRLTRVQVDISNLSPRFDTAFDKLEVWFDGSRNLVSGEDFQTQGTSARLFFDLDAAGLPEGLYNLTIHSIHENDVKYVLVCWVLTINLDVMSSALGIDDLYMFYLSYRLLTYFHLLLQSAQNMPSLEIRDMSVPALIPGAISPTEGAHDPIAPLKSFHYACAR